MKNFFESTSSVFGDVPLGLRWTGIEAALLAIGYSLIRFVAWLHQLPRRARARLLSAIYAIGSAYAWLAAHVANWYAYRYLEVDLARKCPACGVRRQHKVRFDLSMKVGDKTGVLIHDCSCCGASFGEPPLVPVERWIALAKGRNDVH